MSAFARAARPLRALSTILLPAALAALAACDEVNFGAPNPPGPACNGYHDYIHTVAVGRQAARTIHATAAGSLAFTAGGDGGASILDFSDPAAVRMLAVLDTLSDAHAVDVAGSWLFVADGDGGLAVVDASDPARPRVARVVEMPGRAVDVRADGTRVYVANPVIGLVVVDASEPGDARIAGIENTPGRAVGVAASGPRVFVADEQLGVRIVNAVDPASPFLVRALRVPGFPEGIDVHGDVVGVAAGPAGVVLIDVADPASASVVGVLDTPFNALDVALAGDFAYVADALSGVIMVDVSDPARPRARGVFGTPLQATAATVAGDRLVVAGDPAGVRVIDIEPAAAAPVDTIAGGGDARALAPLGNLMVVADAAFGLRVVDTAIPAVVGEIAIGGSPRDLFVADSLAYVVRQNGNIAIVDLHDPAAPAAAGTIPNTDQAIAVAVAGAFAYVVEGGSELIERRLDGTGTPRFVDGGDAFFPTLTMDVHPIAGNLVYLPSRRGSVFVVLPGPMIGFASVEVGGSAERVFLRHGDGPFGPGTGLTMYVAVSGIASGLSAVEVYDVFDLRVPRLIERVACGGAAIDVVPTPWGMAAAAGSGGCELFEGVPGSGVRPAGFLLERAWRVGVSGSRLVVAGGPRGVLLAALAGCLE